MEPRFRVGHILAQYEPCMCDGEVVLSRVSKILEQCVHCVFKTNSY